MKEACDVATPFGTKGRCRSCGRKIEFRNATLGHNWIHVHDDDMFCGRGTRRCRAANPIEGGNKHWAMTWGLRVQGFVFFFALVMALGLGLFLLQEDMGAVLFWSAWAPGSLMVAAFGVWCLELSWRLERK